MTSNSAEIASGESEPRLSSSSAETPAGPSALLPRLESVDLLRGLVIVVMALDHTRVFFSNINFSPVDLKQTFPALFLTRWITHFCAPVFVLLAGTGAFLSGTRGKSVRELSWFLLTRGLWLVLLELTFVNWFGWRFRVDLHAYGVQVIWAIGWSMVVLAALVRLPRWSIMTFGVLLIVFHNAFDGIKPGSGAWAGLWRILHAGGGFEVLPGIRLGVGYPLIPWIGVMAVGYAFGSLLLRDHQFRRKWLLISGAALTLLFVLIRWSNLYGDPTPWAPQQNGLFTVFSFLNCGKYPPSLCYLLMTLGPALCVLAFLDRPVAAALKPILVFGRVPLFFYLLHLPFIHGLSLLVKHFRSSETSPAPDGFGLPGVYLIWVLVVALLYPVCRWFAEYKRTHRYAWLSYL